MAATNAERRSDSTLGVVTGSITALVAALFEEFVVVGRFFSLRGGESMFAVLAVCALASAAAGAAVGFWIGSAKANATRQRGS